MINCNHCPLNGKDLTCPRWTVAHPRFCEWVDPEHPARIEDGAEALVRIARRLAGLEAEESLKPRPHARQLVIAAYQEDLSWLEHVTIPAVVYTKGGAWSRVHPNVSLPNVGREAHSYLYHIVQRWEDLADWTFFGQGDPFDHAPDFIARLALDYRIPTPLTARYRADFPSEAVRAHDRVEWVDGHEVRYGDARHFGLRSEQAGPWIARAWRAVFDGPLPERFWFGYGAMWAVPKSAIHARPLALWRHLLAQIEGPAGRARHEHEGALEHPLNAWAFEILWGSLWSDPTLYPHKAHLAAEPERPRPSVAANLELIRRMKACPHWTKASCGCGTNLCAQGKGRAGQVSIEDCRVCLESIY
jgi:hypothetical protein